MTFKKTTSTMCANTLEPNVPLEFVGVLPYGAAVSHIVVSLTDVTVCNNIM